MSDCMDSDILVQPFLVGVLSFYFFLYGVIITMMSMFEPFVGPLSFSILNSLVALGVSAIPFVLLAASMPEGPNSQDDEEDETEIDVDEVKAYIANLEKLSNRTIEQNEELADLYVHLAFACDEESDLDEVLAFLGNAESILKSVLAHGEESQIRQRLGNVYLHRAVILSEFDEIDESLAAYELAIATLEPLEKEGDGQAKYDIAGIRLNRGQIYHDLGEFDKAMTDFDESFTAFRAVEKITDLDTRFYMAKVSVAQGDLLRDMEAPLEKIIDAYNRSMRLFVELIDMGQIEHECDLANALMRRCASTFDDVRKCDFPSEQERDAKLDAILVDVSYGVQILEKQAASGNEENRLHLMNALIVEADILGERKLFEQAIKVLTRCVTEFADLIETDNLMFLNQYATALDSRGSCFMAIDSDQLAMKDLSESIRLREKVLDEFELDIVEQLSFISSLATTYASRASIFIDNGDNESAKKDTKRGLDLAKILPDGCDEVRESIEYILQTILDQLK
ncbi:MAG: tetratricopeptide repeat protein [Thermoguttaceae bacterium]